MQKQFDAMAHELASQRAVLGDRAVQLAALVALLKDEIESLKKQVADLEKAKDDPAKAEPAKRKTEPEK